VRSPSSSLTPPGNRRLHRAGGFEVFADRFTRVAE
jgi:hypothetical protein